VGVLSNSTQFARLSPTTAPAVDVPDDNDMEEDPMTKFVFTYHDGAGMPEGEEAVAKEMAAWEAWFGTLAAAVVDGGNPFGGTVGIASDGTVREGGSSGLGGYSIVEADDIDAATAMAKGCPILANGGRVEVHAAIEM
jgi:hypothetical protein